MNRFVRTALVFLALLAPVAFADAPPRSFVVVVPDSVQAPVSGRLLVFVQHADEALAAARDGTIRAVDASLFRPGSTTIVAREVQSIAPGSRTSVASEQAFPDTLDALPPGDYVAQAVLDEDHSYAYSGRGAGDRLSAVARFTIGADAPLPALVLDAVQPARVPWTPRPGSSDEQAATMATAHAAAQEVDFVSPALSAFWGRSIHMRAWVTLPPDYDRSGRTRYPTAYVTHGFGGSHDGLTGFAAYAWSGMVKGTMPPMIWVFLDQSSPTGTHEFADSVNNGPWGQALTTELIPFLEQRYRMDAKTSGRFLTGHSSGGWASLWLQTRYPKVFGGSWPTAPDPADFHSFTNVDLYAPQANAYREADGSETPLSRDKGHVTSTLRTFALLEDTLGPVGGQFGSFEWVFSPRGADGRPMPVFDRVTGVVDPTVVAYWHDHYDVVAKLRRDWPQIGHDVDGKLHVIVGSADTFYLNEPAQLLAQALTDLHAKVDVRFIEGRTHFDLLTIGDDRLAMFAQIAWEMEAVARPGSKRP